MRVESYDTLTSSGTPPEALMHGGLQEAKEN